jgi:hypothetical protein
VDRSARYATAGSAAVPDRGGGRRREEIDKIAAVVDATLQTKPTGMTHWSCRTMAQSQGIGKSTVINIWRAHKLQPYRTKTFKLIARSEVSGEDDRCKWVYT